MKKLLSLVLSILFLFQNISFAIETSEETTTEMKGQQQPKAPDFTPPTDLSGPVFPPEDLIGEPSPETNRFLSEFVNMMATLGLIISLILVIAWFLKRMLNTRQEQANTTSLIKVLERRSLSPKTVIYLIEIEGRSLILSESQNGVTRLADYESKDVAEPKELPSPFNQLLGAGHK